MHFFKLFYKNLIKTLKKLKSKRCQVTAFLLEHLKNDNTICATYAEIASQTPVSEDKVGDIMRELIDANIIKRIHSGMYMVNPSIIVKGNNSRFIYLMDIYNNL